MNQLVIPAWLITFAALLAAFGFVISFFWLDETRMFAGMEFGPQKLEKENPVNSKVAIKDFSSHRTSNGSKSVLPTKDICQLESIGGTGHCSVRNENHRWILENSNARDFAADCTAICFNVKLGNAKKPPGEKPRQGEPPRRR